MIPITGNTAALSGVAEGTANTAKGAQGDENKGVFGQFLLAESAPPPAEGSGASTTSGGGNSLPFDGNVLPTLPLEATPAEFDLAVPDIGANGLPIESVQVAETPTVDALAAIAEESLPSGEEGIVSAEALQPQSQLAADPDLSVQTAPVTPAVAVSQASAPDNDLAAVPPGAVSVNPGLSVAEGEAAPVQAQAATGLHALLAPSGKNALSTEALELRPQPQPVIGTGAPDAADSAPRSVLGSAVLSVADKQPVTVAEDVLLQSVDTFGADTNRVKASPLPNPAPPLAGLAALTASDSTSAPAKTVTLAPLTTPPGEPQWGPELANRVSIMMKNGSQEASLQLNPPELGRLDIRIATEGDQARVQFAVHNPDARDVLEQNMPRLRELLEQGGMQLARGDVADHSQNQQQSTAAAAGNQGLGAQEGEAVEETAISLNAGSILDARVDYYV